MKLNFWKKNTTKTAQLHKLGGLLQDRTAGAPVRSGRLSMIPLFGSSVEAGHYSPPEQSLGLTKVTNYGKMILKNRSSSPTIAPLHMGYFQQGAQNHAMCRSFVFAPGEEHEFEDACCIQASQGGYIKEADERFIVLPKPLRKRAFSLRGEENYSKLWDDISVFNESLGLKRRGHLDELKQAFQPDLLRATYRFEREERQTGAVFLHDGALVGVELAPDPAFWAELHNPLVMYCYAPLDLKSESVDEAQKALDGLDGLDGLESIEHLERRLMTRFEQRSIAAKKLIEEISNRALDLQNSGGFAEHKLIEITASDLVGQAVLYNGKTSYLSLTN